MPKEKNKLSSIKLVIALSIVVGLCLSGELAIDIFSHLAIDNSYAFIFRIFLNILFWGALFLLGASIFFYIKLKKQYNQSKNQEALILLGFVVAISNLARYGLSGLEFYEKNTLLPPVIANGILIFLFLLGIFYIVNAIYIFFKE